MCNLVFRKPTKADMDEIEAFKQEFAAYNSGMDGTGILVNSTVQEWLDYIDKMEDRNNPNSVPCFQYGLFQEDGRLLGMLQIRERLLGYLVEFGGHIGYCVRPTERRKGYAKDMLTRGLQLCREKGLEKVMITCLEDNIGSAKTIEACGGIFEKVIYDDVNYQANMKRYWITLI